MSKRGKRVPISDVKEIAQKNGYTLGVLFLWDSETDVQSVSTWGQTLKECEHAAILGNKMKAGMGWPPELCQDKPARQKAKEKKLADKDSSDIINASSVPVKEDGPDKNGKTD